MKLRLVMGGAIVFGVPLLLVSVLHAWFVVSDPGVRGGDPGVGDHVAGLAGAQHEYFDAGRVQFEEADGVAEGLGPRFNLDSCLGCHSQPASGGSSPFENPQVAAATAEGATNAVPSFITFDGPVREARFKRNPDGTPDGGVHSLFVTTGRSDAGSCDAVQEDFEAHVLARNIIFRIPTPVFGAGLVELIPDKDILDNQAANATEKASFGIAGRPNRNGNDGTIARFGWKAQNKSLLLFSGEAYNVEMGITNDNFQTERDENPNCQAAPLPNTVANLDATDPLQFISPIEQFVTFMRFLAPPVQNPYYPGGYYSIRNGRTAFNQVGCVLCHTSRFTTVNNVSTTPLLANQPVRLFSDLLLHHMGPRLADGVSQGQAGGDEFRSAPLWGLGQRIFFLHDGRTNDLLQAISQHRSLANLRYPASEANASIDAFDALPDYAKQNLLNFLRSL